MIGHVINNNHQIVRYKKLYINMNSMKVQFEDHLVAKVDTRT